MIYQTYKRQVDLLLKVLPEVAKENDFALHGGTAINLFVRNMPRLSIDMDLTYIPIESRSVSLEKIDIALEKISSRVKKIFQDVKVHHKKDIGKLLISVRGVEIKLEVNLIGRGLLGASSIQVLSEKAAEEYNAFVAIQAVPFGQLYGGKVCAALDRQHPRDLFDVKYLLENEGLTRDVVVGFLLALISNDRPMIEVLNPNFLDQNKTMENQFSGMSAEHFDYHDFEQTRIKLVELVNSSLKLEDKQFLLSVKSLNPNWSIHDFEKFPAVRWKLQNLEKLKKLNHKKHKQQFDLLREHLEVELVLK
jgi:predicted nucleotidyltransferase component of viral defense system